MDLRHPVLELLCRFNREVTVVSCGNSKRIIVIMNTFTNKSKARPINNKGVPNASANG